MLLFLSFRYNENRPVRFSTIQHAVPVSIHCLYLLQWSDVSVYATLLLSFIFLTLFFLVEIFIAIEPVLPPFLLTQKVPILVGTSNALVAVCNLSVTYFFPVWFQTVMLSSASTAGNDMAFFGCVYV